MSDSDSSQRTGRSQPLPLNQFPRLHEADVTTLSTDNATNTTPSLSHGDGRNYSTLVYKDHDPANATQHHHHGLPSLHIRTDIAGPVSMDAHKENDAFLNQSLSPGSIPRRTPSLRAMLATSAPKEGLSPASISSPQLVAMGDITPLPSPIGGMTSWRHRRGSQSLSRTSSAMSRNGSSLSLRLSDSSQMLGPAESRSRNKPYPGLGKATAESSPDTPDKGPQETAHKHTRNRSLSEYVPPGRSVPIKPRPIAVSGAGLPQGMTSSVSTDPNRGDEAGDVESVILQYPSPDASEEIYSVRSIRTDQPRKYRKLRQLGQGTFSQVSLAVRMENRESSEVHDGPVMYGLAPTTQKLVAVKVIEYGPAGGADEERLEVSLKREVEILKSVNHPSLVQLKAFGSDEKRALLVLDYCPGGDLFDVAASGVKPMSPALIRRIFAELVDAVRYLHGNYIVHRDIKLENVLVTLPPTAMEKITDWRTYDRAVVTLSDLGLSRRIPEPPESPLLQTRCGSEDYAAPEILMGQPYDGRLTDAWALGVLLYAMMENRLPFDALPGARGDPEKLRARTPHRIARCEWAWYRYADSDGEWDPVKGKDLEGARECVEGLLKRNTRRKGLDEIAALGWVKDAIDVPGGLKRGDREVP
ncbi:putative protein kinase [Aspergillus novofumigatus IBT 16806]|uniref:Kinase-like protein n=1 Tax=Aspergillus novofumigatus (strain IBT 16806) TaxID=1392255 RepID=A0A2I1CNP9_ASPN1|nr:kinase-like protein [Aspergillus novofumigatus IBT 16806]PKX99232.1 kinase-like protein [Aspergillus novofumigatus IBT 16806]